MGSDFVRPGVGNRSRRLFQFPEDEVPRGIADEAERLLRKTIATERGRTFNDRADFGECLNFLAVLSGEPTWDFLRGG